MTAPADPVGPDEVMVLGLAELLHVRAECKGESTAKVPRACAFCVYMADEALRWMRGRAAAVRTTDSGRETGTGERGLTRSPGEAREGVGAPVVLDSTPAATPVPPAFTEHPDPVGPDEVERVARLLYGADEDETRPWVAVADMYRRRARAAIAAIRSARETPGDADPLRMSEDVALLIVDALPLLRHCAEYSMKGTARGALAGDIAEKLAAFLEGTFEARRGMHEAMGYARGRQDGVDFAIRVATEVMNYGGQMCGHCKSHEFGTGARRVRDELRTRTGIWDGIPTIREARSADGTGPNVWRCKCGANVVDLSQAQAASVRCVECMPMRQTDEYFVGRAEERRDVVRWMRDGRDQMLHGGGWVSEAIQRGQHIPAEGGAGRGRDDRPG